MAVTEVATAPIGGVGAGQSADVKVTVPATQPQLVALGEGVFPIQVTLTTTLGTVTANTVITHGTQRAALSLVVPFTGDPISVGLLNAQQINDATTADGTLAASLQLAQTTRAIVAVDPAVLAAMRAQGSAASATVQTWLQSFNDLSNDKIQLRFADADVTTLVAANQIDLEPTSLTRYLDPAVFKPQPVPTSSPTTPPPTQAPSRVPTLTELLDTGGAVDKIVWPATGTAASVVNDWAAGANKTILVDSEQAASPAAHAQLGATDAIVYNSELSGLISNAVSEPDPLLRSDTLAQAIAVANVSRQPGVADGEVVGVIERGTRVHREAAADVANTLMAASHGGRLASLNTILARPAVPATFTAAEVDQSRVQALNAMLEKEKAVAEFSAVLTDPSLLTGSQRAEILQLTSSSWLGNAKWSDALAKQDTISENVLHSISVEPLSSIQFLSNSSTIPVRVRNELPFDAQLKLFAVANDFRLDVNSPTVVQAQAGAVSRVLIPVTTRINNGDAQIRFWLTAKNGHVVGAEMKTDIYVRAEWEKWGILGGSAVIVLLLVGGIFRMIHKRRKARKAKDSVVQAEQPDAVEEGAKDLNG